MELPRQDTGSPPQGGGVPVAKYRRDRRIRLAFLALTVVLVTLIYFRQRAGLSLPGWGNDLSAALTQAAAENRPVLAFFVSSPPSHTSRELTKTTIPKNDEAIEKGRFIKVMVKVKNLAHSEWAVRYKIASLPTMLVIGSDGVEKNRREGFIGELEFRKGFLDCTEVIGPAKTP
jgi:hypothetical protein